MSRYRYPSGFFDGQKVRHKYGYHAEGVVAPPGGFILSNHVRVLWHSSSKHGYYTTTVADSIESVDELSDLAGLVLEASDG